MQIGSLSGKCVPSLRSSPEDAFRETSQTRINVGVSSCHLQLNTISVSLKESVLIDAL